MPTIEGRCPNAPGDRILNGSITTSGGALLYAEIRQASIQSAIMAIVDIEAILLRGQK
jgi:hypothetical protein